MEYIEKLDCLNPLLDKFINYYTIYHRKFNEELGMDEYEKRVILSELCRSGIKEEEMEYAFDYLNKHDITVVGDSIVYCNFENYVYHPYTPKNIINDSKVDYLGLQKELEEYQLETDLPKKDIIRKSLIEKNINLVKRLVSSYRDVEGVSQGELLSYGYEGLILAIDNYSIDSGYNFSTYAVKYIKGFILKGIPRILGFNDVSMYYKVFAAKTKIEENEDKKIENFADMIKEISDVMEASEQERERIMFRVYKSMPLSIENIDEPIDETTLYHETIDKVFQEEVRKTIIEKLEKAPYKYANLLANYYGLEGYEKRTASDMEKETGLTRQGLNFHLHSVEKYLEKSSELESLYNEKFNEYSKDYRNIAKIKVK